LFFAACSSQETPAPAPQAVSTVGKNVLLITLDTLRADYLGCYGKTDIETPNLDRLAAEGVRFDHAVVQVPLTTPSHASILTGAYPPKHQIRDVGGFILDEKIPTLAGVMEEHGFQTAAFVAASVLHHRYGLNRGFETYSDKMSSDPDVEKLPGVVAEVRGDTVTERALEWLRGRDRSKGFFLWVHYYDPHFPYDPPHDYRARYEKDLYAGEVAFVDTQVGALLDALKAEQLTDSTLVVAISDHGESLGDHGEQTHGVFLYDSTVRVPLLIAGPGVRRNVVADQLARSIDVMPTALDFAGLQAPSGIDGESLLPLLRDGRPVRINYSYMETFYPQTQMRWSELFGVRTVDRKYILAPKPELYDLEADKSESTNIIGQHAEEADRLQKEVWRVSGEPGKDRQIAYRPIDEATMRELQSLGYVSSSSARKLVADLSGPDPKDRVGILKGLDHATHLMNAGDFSRAIPILQKLTTQDPQNPLIYQDLGICLQETRNFKGALALYERAIKNGADTDRTYSELGEIQIRLGHLDAAVESLKRSADINPRNLDNLSNLVNAYLQLGKLDDAEAGVQAILTQNPEYAVAYNLRGMIAIQRQRPELARESFQKAVNLDPQLVEPYMNLGILAQMAGDNPAAIRNLEAFLERAEGAQYAQLIPKVRAALAQLKSEAGASSPSR